MIKNSQVQAYFILKPLLDPYVMYLCTTAHILCCVLTDCLSLCSNEFSQLVASEYLNFFDFSGLSLDRALR